MLKHAPAQCHGLRWHHQINDQTTSRFRGLVEPASGKVSIYDTTEILDQRAYLGAVIKLPCDDGDDEDWNADI